MKKLVSYLAVGVMALSLLACGKKGPGTAADVRVRLPPANPAAVGKMVQGITFAKEPRGRAQGIALLREAVKIDPNLWEAHFDLGLVLAMDSDLSGAESSLKTAHGLAPDQEDVAVALAEVRRRRGLSKDAAEGLEAFVAQNPGATDARSLLASTLRDSGQYEKAIKEAREVLVRKSGDASALAELALCHLAKQERESAKLLARQAIDANPKSAVAHRVMGLIQLAEGDDALAFASFQKAAQEDPRDTTARLNMGGVLLRAGAYAKAEEQYRAALQVAPDDLDAQVGLAAALRGESEGKPGNKLDEAKTLLDKVLDKDPKNGSALFNMGVLLTDFMKKPDQGRPMFERFLDVAPKNHPSRADAEKRLAMAPKSAPSAPPAPPAPATTPPAKAPGGKS